MRRKARWLASLIWMAAAMTVLTAALVGASLFLPSPAAGYLYSAGMWALAPLAGGAAAFLSTRAGLSNYAAWAVPPVCQVAAHWLLLGYPPSSAGMPLVTAAVCLVAAATAQVLNERQTKTKKGGGRAR